MGDLRMSWHFSRVHPVNETCQALLEPIIGIKLIVVNEFFVYLPI